MRGQPIHRTLSPGETIPGHFLTDILLEELLVHGCIIYPAAAVPGQFVVAETPEDDRAVLKLAVAGGAEAVQDRVQNYLIRMHYCM